MGDATLVSGFKSSVAAIAAKVTAAFKLHWTLHAITYPLLVVYFAPVLVLWWTALHTSYFTNDPEQLVKIAVAIAGPFFETVRSTVSAVFVPFVMAYAIKNRDESNRIPVSSLVLFFVLLSFFVASTALYAVIEWKRTSLGRFDDIVVGDKEVPVAEMFKSVATSYAKEALTYIALVLGIALRPAMTTATGKGNN